MSTCLALDSVLAGLARPFGRSSDLLLDLRQWADDDRRAGSCVKAYFDLFEEATSSGEAARGLAGLRQWLEAEVEIAVLDRMGHCLEILPLELAGEEDLERFCHKVMNRLREDRCHASPEVRMIPRFKPRHAQAA
ncbi:MAG TPA: hypothetical protein VIM57_02245 [Luteolibacter sp.]